MIFRKYAREVLPLLLVLVAAAPAAAQGRLGSDLLDLGRGDDRSFADERRPEPEGAGSPLGVFGQRLDLGPFDVGLSVVSPRLMLAPADADAASTMRYRLTERSLASTDFGVDLRLRWPSWTGAGDSLQAVQPYVSIGPSLPRALVTDTLAGRSARGDAGLGVGVHGSVGLTWKLAPSAALYGEYRLTQERPFAGRQGAGEVGSDFFYGFSLKY